MSSNIDIDIGSLIDLSHRLNSNALVYPGDPVFTCRPFASIETDGYSVQAISMGSHTGTHVDAPSHFFTEGKTIDQIPLSTFVGNGLVIDLASKGPRQKIVWDDLAAYAGQMKEGVILLLYTGWSKHWCTPKYYEHPFLDRDAAERIVVRGIRVLGVDTLNPDETCLDGTVGEGFGVHEVILGAGGVIAENLTNLNGLIGRDVMVSLIPLNLDGSDGSPIRAFAWRAR